MRRERIRLTENEPLQKRYGSTVVSIHKTQGAHIERISPLETAHHEAAHVVMALILGISVIEATDKPGPGYGGYTLTGGGGSDYERALVFAAAEAQGSKGTGKGSETPGSDMFWIRQLGFEPEKIVADARKILSREKNQDRILAVATRIRNKRFIQGQEAENVSEEAKKDTLVAVRIETKQNGREIETRQIVILNRLTNEFEIEIPEETPGVQELRLAA